MSFRTWIDVWDSVRGKYTSTAANIFGLLCHSDERKREIFWGAMADASGTSSNSPGFSIGYELQYLYDDFVTPVESYGYVSFHLDFDNDFELEGKMPLPEFIEYLKDANAVACKMYPKDTEKLQNYLAQAIEKATSLQKAHERWKRKNS